jgi:hypothetical protein
MSNNWKYLVYISSQDNKREVYAIIKGSGKLPHFKRESSGLFLLL